MQRIFLIGLSGSGKSTVAQHVARMLGWDVVDTDVLLSERCGLPVGQVLIEYGEQKFRQMESETLLSTAYQDRIVIATGGEAVIAEANRIFIRAHGLTVYLETSVETACHRIQEPVRKAGFTVVHSMVAA